MEEIFVVALQLFFECFLQLFVSGLLDNISFGKAHNGCALFVVHMVFGGGLGWLSTLIVPVLFLTHPGARVAYLIIAPILAGAISTWIVCIWQKTDRSVAAFWHGFVFALLFGLARLAFGVRG
jgi:hypothetical protein